jgi:hypothetical protein
VGGNVARDDDQRHAALADRLADRDLEGARHLVGARDELAVMAALVEERLGMRLLEVAAASDAEDRNTRAVAVEQAIDEVQIARTAAPGANCELTGYMRLRPGAIV